MDTIQALLKILIRLSIGLILLVFVWWLVVLMFPSLSLKTIFSNVIPSTATSSSDGGWLPAPRNIGLFGKAKVPSVNDNVYVPGEPFNGYGNINNKPAQLVAYSSVDQQGSNSQQVSNNNQNSGGGTIGANNDQSVSQRSLYIRNLSMYEGGHVYTGFSFVGEAKESMFKNGQFPIIIIDTRNAVIAVTYAQATTNWSIPGWVRFQVKISSALPNKVPCTMIFQSANSIPNQQPVRVAIPIMCN